MAPNIGWRGNARPEPVIVVSGTTDVGAALLAQTTGLINVAGKQSFTRQNDATPYTAPTATAAGDYIGPAVTAALDFTGFGLTGYVTNLQLSKTGTGVVVVRAHLVKTNHALTNADNGAFLLTSLNQDNYIGFIDVTMVSGASGGAHGSADVRKRYSVAAGHIFVHLEALTAYTPTAVEVITGVLSGDVLSA